MLIVSSRQGSVTLSRKTVKTKSRVANITISVETGANFKFASLARHSDLLSSLDSDPQFQLDPETLPDHSPVHFELSPPTDSPPPLLNGDCESGHGPDEASESYADSKHADPSVEDLVGRVTQMVLAHESSQPCGHMTNGNTLAEPELPWPRGPDSYSPNSPPSPTHGTGHGTNCLSPCGSDSLLRKSRPAAKRVKFADECGRQLATTHIFSEPHLLDMELSVSPTQLSSAPGFSSVAACPIAIHFEQPAGNYLAFKARLEACNVALENVLVELSDAPPGAESPQTNAFSLPPGKEWRVYGTLKVKNISFHKHVFARVTTDNWWSSSDVVATYVQPAECVAGAAISGPAPLENTASAYGSNAFAAAAPARTASDTFSFDLREIFCKLLTSSNVMSGGERRIEFCLGYETAGQKFWDNNDSRNYTLTCTLPTRPDRDDSAGRTRPVGVSSGSARRGGRMPTRHSHSLGDLAKYGSASLFGLSPSFSDEEDELHLNGITHDLQHQGPFTSDFRPNFEKYRGRRGSFGEFSVWSHFTSVQSPYY